MKCIDLTDMDIATRYVSFIESKKRRTCLLLVLNGVTNDFEKVLFQAADTVNRNMMFYLMDAATSEWSVIIKVKDTNKTVKNILRLTPDLKAIENRYFYNS